jgi:hypothetical protein
MVDRPKEGEVMGYSTERMDDMESREHCDIWSSCPDEYESCEECRKRANQSNDEEEGE